jgi:hypothetical protein
MNLMALQNLRQQQTNLEQSRRAQALLLCAAFRASAES